MAETLLVDNSADAAAAPPSNGSLFHRRIEFLPAKKPFTGFSTGGGGGFQLETLNPTTSDQNKRGGGGVATEGRGGGRAEAKNELGKDPELSYSIRLGRIGAGLENLGNTCFLNSVLQCLTYTEPLAAYLQSGRHKSSCRKAGFCALCSIQNHVSRALQSSGRSLAPKDLVSNLRCISRNFRNARQEDAHEYMVNLLESMHKCCLPSGVPSESPSAFDKSLVHKIFGGRLRSQVKCTQCSFCSDKFDPFLDLSLEINNADSLQKALVHFTEEEFLDGGAKEYHCQRCKQKVKALKKLSIYKAPNVLNIHLKRFGGHHTGQKINKKVHFGTTLDLKPFVTGAYDGDLKYSLYGVLVHWGGNTHSGHYYCFVRTSSGIWHSLDDHKVRHVSENIVLNEKAYMLFYVRDQKYFAPKKPIDVNARSMIINAMGNRVLSNSNPGAKMTVQIDPTYKRVGSLIPSAALTQVNVAVDGALRECLKGKSIEGTAQVIMAESSFQKDAQLTMASTMPVVKDEVKGLSSGESSIQAAVTSESCKVLDKDMSVTIGNEVNKFNKERTTSNTSNSICSENLAVKEAPSDEVVFKTNEVKAEHNMATSLAVKPMCNGFHNPAGNLDIKDNIPLEDCNDKVSMKINPLKKVEEPGHDNTQIGGLSKESNDSNGVKEMEGVEVSKLLGIESSSFPLHKKDLDRHSRRKSKKKSSKAQVTRTRLSSGIILGAALGLRKKKQKKTKRSAIKIDILTQEHLGPSTSEITRPLSVGSADNSQRNGSRSGANEGGNISLAKNEKGSICNLVEGGTNKNFRERVGKSEVLATDKHRCNGSVGREANNLEKSRSYSLQNGLMNMLTRGLEDTVVARWDEKPSLIAERSGMEPVRIGYIGDDWDEEYDQGKRRKVRDTKIEFGGPNPFQEIASQKAKFKKARVDRASSANRPFRIRGQ